MAICITLFQQSKDARLKVICGNHFKLTKELLGEQVDCVWDRGAMEAIDLTDRKRYILSNILETKLWINRLIITVMWTV